MPVGMGSGPPVATDFCVVPTEYGKRVLTDKACRNGLASVCLLALSQEHAWGVQMVVKTQLHAANRSPFKGLIYRGAFDAEA